MDDQHEHDEHEVEYVPEERAEPPAPVSPPEARTEAEAPRESEPPRASEPPAEASSSAPPPREGREGHTREERRSRLEGLLRESMRRAIEKGLEAGVGTITRADSAIRGVVDEAKLPRELLGYVFSQVEDGKNVVVGAVAKEVREFLESTDLAAELRRALTSLSFEIKTEIRFIPNEKGEMKPKVKSRVGPKRVASRRGADERDEDAPDDEGDEDRFARRPSARRSRAE